MVDFWLHPASSAAISRGLRAGNRGATSRDLPPGQNPVPRDFQPIPQTVRSPQRARFPHRLRREGIPVIGHLRNPGQDPCLPGRGAQTR
jgi:hypothetical protein